MKKILLALLIIAAIGVASFTKPKYKRIFVVSYYAGDGSKESYGNFWISSDGHPSHLQMKEHAQQYSTVNPEKLVIMGVYEISRSDWEAYDFDYTD